MQVVFPIDSLTLDQKQSLRVLKAIYDGLKPVQYLGYQTARIMKKERVDDSLWEYAIESLAALSNPVALGARWMDGPNLIECWTSRKDGLIFIAKPIAIL